MYFLFLTLLYGVLNAPPSDPTLEYPSFPEKILKSIPTNPTTKKNVEPAAINIILQSKDGGQTWEDISQGLPENELPEDFFAGESEIYLRIKNEMYRSKSNLNTLVWEKESPLYPRGTSIAFNRSGVTAFNMKGQVYQKQPSSEAWLTIYTNFDKPSVRTVFETSDGIVFVGCDYGLFKSDDKGKNWKQVLGEGYVVVTDLVDSEGVLIGPGRKGVLRSTDRGEHWEWIVSDGGLAKVVERIEGGFAAISYAPSTESSRLRISLDNGKNWKVIDEGLPRALFILSIKQMGKYLICGHPDGIFLSSDMGETWRVVQPVLMRKCLGFMLLGIRCMLCWDILGAEA